MNHPSIQWRILLLTLSLGMDQASIAAAEAKLDKELFVQCGYGNVEQVADLLKQGANSNATNEYGVSALHLAARDGHLKLIQLLIENGARVNVRDHSGGTPLKDAAGSNSSEALKLLLKAGAEPDSSAFSQACWLGRTDTVRLLMDAGIRPDAGLANAAQGGHIELVRLLLAKGADVNRKAESGVTALHLAALQGGLKTVGLLLEKGADPNATNKDNETPLHMAIAGDGDIEIIKLLVKYGAQLNIANKEGITPVRLASIRSAKEAYDFLLTASDGREPSPVGRDVSKSNKQLISDLTSNKRETRIAAQRELTARGEEIIPEVLNAIESGTGVEHFYELFQAMGPEADAALPKLESQLNKKEHVYIAGTTIERMKPGAFAKLNDDSKRKAAEALYEALMDPKIDVAAGVHARMLIALGEPAVPTIIRLLRHDKSEIRAFMARQLATAQFQSDALRDELIKLQAEDQPEPVRADAARALANPKFQSMDAKAALIQQLRTPAIVVEYSPHQSEAEREAANSKKREVDELLEQSARALAAYGPTMVDELLPLIRNQNDPASEQFKKVWSYLGHEAVPKFQALLDHEDDRIRRSAYQELGRLAQTSPEALETLITRLEIAESAHRQLAADALWNVRGNAADHVWPKLLARLGDDVISVRTRSLLVQSALRFDPIQTKASKGVRQFLPRIIDTAMNGEYFDRCIALETLGALGAAGEDALPQLRELANQPLPQVPPGPQPLDEKSMTPAWKKALSDWGRADNIRRQAKEAIRLIEKDTEETK